MIAIDAYNSATLQSFLSLIKQFADSGVTDSRIIVEQLRKKIGERSVVPVEKEVQVAPATGRQCPSCGSDQWYFVERNDSSEKIKYMACKKCRYSVMV